MTASEYEYLQERFRQKLTNNSFTGNKREAYKAGIRAAMSILSDEYHREVKQNGHAG